MIHRIGQCFWLSREVAASEKLKGTAPKAPLGRIAFGEAIHRGAKRRPPGASRRSTVRSGSQSAFEHPHGTSPSSKALRKDPRAFSPPSKETHPKPGRAKGRKGTLL